MNDKDINGIAPSPGNGGQAKGNSGWPENSGDPSGFRGESSGQARPEDRGEGGLPGGGAADVSGESSADVSGRIGGEGAQIASSFDMRVFEAQPDEFVHEQTLAEDEGYIPLSMRPAGGGDAKAGAAVSATDAAGPAPGNGAGGSGGGVTDGDDGGKDAGDLLPTGFGPKPAPGEPGEPGGSGASDGKTGAGKARPGVLADLPKRPRLDSPDIGPATVSSKIFSFFSLVPIFWLVAILAGLTVWGLGQRELWFSDEVRHGNAFQNLLYHGKWLVLEMNGHAYPDKPPLYFWFLRGLYELVKVEGPFLYLLAAAVSGLLYLLSFLALGKFVARFDRRALFASGLVLLLCGYVYGTLHYARMDLLFSALIVASQVMLYLALIRGRSLPLMGLAFFLAGLAVLVKGPLGIALPIVTGLVFIAWCGNFKRLFRLDVVFGLVVFAVVVGLWAGAIIRQTGGTDYLFNEILGRQVAGRAIDAFHHKQPWHYYFSRLPLAFLPFTFIFFCLPWTRFLGKGMRQAIAESRKPEKDGLGFVWIMLITGFAVLSLTSTKILIYFMPVFPALALVTGRAILALTGARASAFRYLVAIFLFVAAVGLVVAAFMLNGLLPLPDIKGVPGWPPLELAGALLVAAIVLICACWMAFALGNSRPEGVLLSLTVAWLLFSWPMGKLVAPAFDNVLSPKGQALVLKEYADAGYEPVSYREYEGTYTYYARHNTRALQSLDDARALAAEGRKYILAMRAKDWDEWQNRPDCLRLADRRWIAEREYVLAACQPAAPVQAVCPPAQPARAVQPVPPAEDNAPGQPGGGQGSGGDAQGIEAGGQGPGADANAAPQPSPQQPSPGIPGRPVSGSPDSAQPNSGQSSPARPGGAQTPAAPDSGPGASLNAAPQAAPGAAGDAAPAAAPNAVPNSALDSVPRAAPQAAPEASAGTAPQAAPEATPQTIPDAVPHAAPPAAPASPAAPAAPAAAPQVAPQAAPGVAPQAPAQGPAPAPEGAIQPAAPAPGANEGSAAPPAPPLFLPEQNTAPAAPPAAPAPLPGASAQ